MKTKRLVCGVGINDADYVVVKYEEIGYVAGKQKQKRVWTCPCYQTWSNMLQRCYSISFQEHNQTYIGCTVEKEWHTFSNFRAWMMTQDFDGLHLDKDLLFERNKVYGADTCVFLTRAVNNFVNDHGAKRGRWMIGVAWNKKSEKFQSSCGNPFTGDREHLGYFTTEIAAHQAWAKRKLELAHLLAAEQEDPRVAKALIDRYSKPQEQRT